MAVAELEMHGHFFFKEEGSSKKNVVFGIQQAVSFARKVAAGEKVGRKRYQFDDEFVREVHKRAAYGTGHEGKFRTVEGFELGGIPLAPTNEIPAKFYLYGRWLKRATTELKNEDVGDPIKSLEVAAAAHHGLVRPAHHPFNNANGRSARVISNAVLMANTYELRVHHKAIPPVPLLRSHDSRKDPYIDASAKVNETGDLLFMMSFMAKKWADTLDERHLDIYTVAPRPLNRMDSALLESIEERSQKLKRFISDADKKMKSPKEVYYPLPEYFSIENLHY